MRNIIRLVAIVMVALGSPAFLQAVEAQATSPDAVALDRLARSGSDLSKLHRVDFFLRFPDQEAAENAESQLRELAFATETDRGDSGNGWVVRASKAMYPVESDLIGLRDKLNVIAAEGRGTYDGWQARAVK